MNGNGEHESQLVIDRLKSVYWVSQGHPAPDQLRSQLDQTMHTRLAAACERWLSTLLDPTDPSIWLIRRVALDLALDVGGLDEDAVARVWSRSITSAVVRAIEQGPDGQSVLYFPDRAAYLAYFLGELVAGRAWGRWHLYEFETLRSLPPGAAAAQALVRKDFWAEPALLLLAEQGKLAQVLALMTNSDARLTLDACAANELAAAAQPIERATVDALLTLWVEIAPSLGQQWLADAIVLRIYIEVRRRFPALDSDSLRLCVARLVSLARLLQATQLATDALATLATSHLAAALALAHQAGGRTEMESLAYFAASAAGDASWLAGVLGAARTSAPQSVRPLRRPGGGEIIATPHAGLFLLLPALSELGLSEIISSARYTVPKGLAEDLHVAQLLRYLLFLKLCGGERSQQTRYDAALLAATGLEHSPAADDLALFTTQTQAGEDRRCLTALAAALARSGRLGLRCLHVEIIAVDSMRTLLVRDTQRGDWLYAAPLENAIGIVQVTLDNGIALLAGAIDAAPNYLLVDATCAAEIDTTALTAQGVRLIQSSDISRVAQLPDTLADLAGYLARARSSDWEVAYFSLRQPPLITSPHFDLTWSVAARAIFRTFARKLLGFRDSSTPYLWQNFLAGVGQVQIGQGSIDVRLPLSPLRMMLRLAGLSNMTYSVPWLDGVEINVRMLEE